MSDASPSDEDLHRRVIQGDETALELIDSRYQARVTGWAQFKKGLPLSEAEAAWNEALLSFWTNAATVSPVGSIRRYVFGVVAHKVADYYRAKDPTMYSKDVGDAPPTRLSPLHREARARPLPARVAACLDRLGPDHRKAIDLVVLQGMMVRDAADLLKALPNTLTKRTTRALEQLRKCVENRDER